MGNNVKQADVMPVMVGTAGHVDHGKSALVKLLTGCEMDRHPEARARGLTIDLGFAPCRIAGNRMAGIIDVPGHEDFIRNMVAGASSIDVLMLVVAADDGVMPQTREHLQIVRLLRKARLMVVVTKIDLVDKEMRELVREGVAGFVAENGFLDAPVLLASNITFEGITQVRETLEQMVSEVRKERDDRAFRMNVERVFSVKGYGTVVTGIPTSGELAVGGKAELLPAGGQHVLRAVQTYKMEKGAAVAGACAALNLRDLDAEKVERGMAVAACGIYRTVSGFIVIIKNEHRSIKMKRLLKIKFHSGTGSANASIKLIDRDTLAPGEECFAHVRLEKPMVLASGDRFVIRNLSPTTTLGGGMVLSVRDYKFKRSDRRLLPRLQAAGNAVLRGDLLMGELLAGPEATVTRQEALRLTQCENETADGLLRAAVDAGGLGELGRDAYFVPARADEILKRAEKILERYHKGNPYKWGMDPALFTGAFDLPAGAFKALAKLACNDGRIRVRNGRIALSGFEPALSERQMKLVEQITSRIVDGGINAPARGNLMKELSIPEKEMRLLTRLLGEDGLMVVVGTNLVDREVFEGCRKKMLELFEHNDIVDLNQFRQATGASRNLAITILEMFDGEGLTKRVGDRRALAR